MEKDNSKNNPFSKSNKISFDNKEKNLDSKTIIINSDSPHKSYLINENIQKTIEYLNNSIDSKVSLKNELFPELGKCEVNFKNDLNNSNKENSCNQLYTKDEDFLKQMQNWKRTFWIENGGDPEEYDKRFAAPSKVIKKINTLDNFIQMNNNKNNMDDKVNETKLKSIDNSSYLYESKKFNEMNIDKKLNKESSYNNTSYNFYQKNKQAKFPQEDDIDERDRNSNIYANKKSNNNGGYLNSFFGYKRKQ